MNLSHKLLAALSVLALATVALAFDLTITPVPDNVVSNRLAGTWTLNTDITKRMDAERTTKPIERLEFTNDASVLKRLSAVSKRFETIKIFASGMMTFDGAAHPYILINNGGNMSLVWFTAGKDGTLTDVSKVIHIATSRVQANDLLFFGGDAKGEPSTAYERAPMRK